MANLGDFFSKKDSESLFNSIALTPGTIIRCFSDITTPPKIKFLIVISVTNDAAYIMSVFINKHINWKVHKTEELVNLQYPIKPQGFKHLKFISYIDCSDLSVHSYQEIYDQISKKYDDCVCGCLSEDDFNKVKALLVSSPKITAKKLKLAGLI